MPEIVSAFLLGYVTEWMYFLEDPFPHPSSDWSPKNHSIVKMDESRRVMKFEIWANIFLSPPLCYCQLTRGWNTLCKSLPWRLGCSSMLFLKCSIDRNPSLWEPGSRSVVSDLLQGSGCPNISQLFWAQRMQFALNITWK